MGRTEKLRAQYEWYARYQGLPHIPVLLNAGENRDSFFFDLEFATGFRPFFEFVHEVDAHISSQVLSRVVHFTVESIHKPTGQGHNELSYLSYLNEKLMPKIEECLTFIPGFESFVNAPEISINGATYRGLPEIQHILYTDAELRRYLSAYEECTVQGDLTFENILVDDKGDFLITDPNVGNSLSSPLIDFAKLYQSLHSGYEFLRKIDDVQVSGSEIIFKPAISATYEALFGELQNILKAHISPDQEPALIFHEAMHFARLLPYRAKESPPVFYACFGTMIRLFNEFLEEFYNAHG